MIHDFGSVRIYEVDDYLEISFPKDDMITREAVKSYKGRWVPDRKSWKIESRWAGIPLEKVCADIRSKILAGAPDFWAKSWENLSLLVTVTKRYNLRIGEAGARITLPRGDNLGYKLNKMPGVSSIFDTWYIPSSSFNTAEASDVLKKLLALDEDSLSKSVDYLEGFTVTGKLNITDEEIERMNVSPGNDIFADTSFIKAVYPDIPSEPMSVYPLNVVSLKRDGDYYTAKLAFVTGSKAYKTLRLRLRPNVTQNNLDVRHAEGKWERRRG